MRTMPSVLSKAGWVQIAAKGPISLRDSDPRIGRSLNTGIDVKTAQSKIPGRLNATDKSVGSLRDKNTELKRMLAKLEWKQAPYLGPSAESSSLREMYVISEQT